MTTLVLSIVKFSDITIVLSCFVCKYMYVVSHFFVSPLLPW